LSYIGNPTGRRERMDGAIARERVDRVAIEQAQRCFDSLRRLASHQLNRSALNASGGIERRKGRRIAEGMEPGAPRPDDIFFGLRPSDGGKGNSPQPHPKSSSNDSRTFPAVYPTWPAMVRPHLLFLFYSTLMSQVDSGRPEASGRAKSLIRSGSDAKRWNKNFAD
jgi:hypothetical protein